MSIEALVPHLHFEGTCAEAIALYERALGATVVALMRWREMPGGGKDLPPEALDKVMHARLQVGKAALLVADTVPNAPSGPRANGSLMLEFDDPEDMAKRFDALAHGGKVTMPVHDAFWGAKFGMLVDAFGVPWMFHCEKKGA